MNKQSREKLTLSVSAEMKDQLNQFMLEDEAFSLSETVRSILASYIRHRIKNGKKGDDTFGSKQVPKIPDTPELLCTNVLDGKVVGGRCEYYQYDGVDRFKDSVDLKDLNQEHVDKQYLPSKETVLKLQASGKAQY